eukprot:2418828-Pyramimonas_sp.AAC.1
MDQSDVGSVGIFSRTIRDTSKRSTTHALALHFRRTIVVSQNHETRRLASKTSGRLRVEIPLLPTQPSIRLSYARRCFGPFRSDQTPFPLRFQRAYRRYRQAYRRT